MYFVEPVEVKKFINEPMLVLQWSCHAQAIEYVQKMKQITEAAGRVQAYTHKTREDQEASRRLMSRNESKQDLMNCVTYYFLLTGVILSSIPL